MLLLLCINLRCINIRNALSLLFYVNEHSVRKGNTMNKSKVTNTVKDFVRKTGEHCMVLTLNKDGTSLEGAGDDTWVSVLREKPELLQSLTTALIEAADLRDFEDALVPAVFPKKLPRLFAVPGSKQWKGIKVRSQLSTYLGFFGYGHNMAKRYGEGEPPHGWPVQVVWSTFKGPSKSCTLTLCTEIICQLLEAQEIIPANHGPMDEEEENIMEDVGNEGIRDRHDEDTDPETDEQSNQGEKVHEEGGNVLKRKKTINEVLDRQAREEINLSAYKRRRENMTAIADGLQALEGGGDDDNQEENLDGDDQEEVLDDDAN